MRGGYNRRQTSHSFSVGSTSEVFVPKCRDEKNRLSLTLLPFDRRVYSLFGFEKEIDYYAKTKCHRGLRTHKKIR
jgi:hypothetical protein